ncbi:MAG TPA: hypothetical protein VNE86_05635, partial [Nitrososphaerales archaeon]|nr:hypothetical protein [Nitrososphaerales archaeon]
LNPHSLYYVLADSCNFCHGSTHNVTFTYWDNSSTKTNPMLATVGSSLNAWYTYVPQNSTTPSGDSPIIPPSIHAGWQSIASSSISATGSLSFMIAKQSFSEAES